MSFGTAYATKKRAGKGMKCAEGGEVPSSLEEQDKRFSDDMSAQNAQHSRDKMFAEQNEAIANDVGKYAHGGMAEHEQDADMIARIMHKRKEYAKGGEVANDVGVAEADELPAEFDDMVLDDHLEDDSGAGNEKGDSDVSDDPIDRLMMKRKKDKLPRPA